MSRSHRFLAAAACAALLAAPAAFAQQPPPPAYQPVPAPAYQAPPPAQPPPGAYQAPPPAYAPPAPPAAPPPAYAPPAAPLKSQSGPGVQLEAFAGWQVNGDVDGVYGKLEVDDTQSFGVSLWKQLRPGSKLKLLWLYSNLDARFESYSYAYPSSRTFGVMQNYFQIGGVQSMRRGRIEPFAGGTLGAVWWSPDNMVTQDGRVTYDTSDTWRFGVTLGLGLNVFLTEKLALRGHADMLVPMVFNGGTVYVGTGGSGVAVNSGVPAVSGDFGVGLVYAP
jgi:opacity protein-like surface antigen